MKKILVVDDSKTIRTLCEWIYKGLEDRVFTADSAASAREVIGSEHPDVVVVDYTLPDEDSYEFVSSIRDASRVIMMGGTFAEFDESKARENGACAVVMKPFRTSVFFDAVEEAMQAALEPVSSVSENTPIPSSSMSQGVSSSSGLHSAASSSGLRSVSPSSGIHTAVPGSGVNSIVPNSGLHSVVPNSGIRPAAQSFARIHSSSGISPAVNDVAPISGVSGSDSGIHAASKRFNFPGASSPSIPVSAHVEGATPKTPVPSISPAVNSGVNVNNNVNNNDHANSPQIDPVLLRAEVIAAVKSMLPAIVSSYLKRLIQAEVKPQLQSWVDTRVEALIKKMMQ